jgi:hypothetical protein
MFTIYYKIIIDSTTEIDISYISSIFIEILGLLPQKNFDLKLLQVPNSGNLLEVSLPELFEEMKVAI